ncbi:MAG: cytochrome c [Rhodovarius sp.]|nr:cytochrome c [Rhodovarius sp.]MDW8314315.1 cytochrome c [Rhodovarius sp.]
MARGRWAAGLVCAGLLAFGSMPAAGQDGSAAAGRAFAERHCARCHAIGRTGASPQPAAPPLRELHRRYPVEQLAEAFAEGVVTGHAGMPEFQLEVAQINDLLAFLRSLER